MRSEREPPWIENWIRQNHYLIEIAFEPLRLLFQDGLALARVAMCELRVMRKCLNVATVFSKIHIKIRFRVIFMLKKI